jgi:hypothetical protein
MERKQFKKLFPHLAKEMESGRSKAELGKSSEIDNSFRNKGRRWAGYNPDIIDFIRRCETIEQAREVINYLKDRGEITNKLAVEIKQRLDKEGLRSFSTKKERDFYHNNI